MKSSQVSKEDIQKALETLQSGGLIVYPTDTVWGIGCDATNQKAVEKLFEIKERDKSKSMLILLHNENQLASYVRDIPDVAYELIEATDRPLTLVYDGAKNLADNLIAEDGSIGIRIVDHPFCTALLQRFRKPIVSTSANISGQQSPSIFSEISEEILSGADYIVDYQRNNSSNQSPSIMIKIDKSGKFTILRS